MAGKIIPDVLSQWEAEATCTIPDCKCETDWNRKIKALITLVRKKDDALGFIHGRISYTEFPNLRGSSEECKVLSDCSHMSEAALALTKELSCPAK